MSLEYLEESTRNDLAAMREQMKTLEASPDSVIMERRILQRDIEALEHRLDWIEKTPRIWKRGVI